MIGGKRVRAVPITDHLGLDGTVTTHYVDAAGSWLGSYNKQTKILMLPSDEQTLAAAWKIDPGRPLPHRRRRRRHRRRRRRAVLPRHAPAGGGTRPEQVPRASPPDGTTPRSGNGSRALGGGR